MRTRSARRAASLRVTRAVDFTYWTDVPLAVDANMPQVVTFEA